MILMWKDEQFGLTFLAVLNEGPPSILTSHEEITKAATFSVAGTIFIMRLGLQEAPPRWPRIYCLAAALSAAWPLS